MVILPNCQAGVTVNDSLRSRLRKFALMSKFNCKMLNVILLMKNLFGRYSDCQPKDC